MLSNKAKQSEKTDLPCNLIEDPEFKAQVAENAYFKSAARDFKPGHELDDWLQAEQEIYNQSH